jgi:nucleotide-binding universal stress UspA family protein
VCAVGEIPRSGVTARSSIERSRKSMVTYTKGYRVMSWRSVLLHCNDERRFSGLMDFSASFLRKFPSHLVGLSVVPPPIYTGDIAGPPLLLDEHCKAYRKASERMKAAFFQSTTTAGIDAEWLEEEAGDIAPVDIALSHANASDLIIASQTDRSWSQSAELDLVEPLVLESGRPVVVVPNSVSCPKAVERIVVAWNGRREAARAVFDALPALKMASYVAVVSIGPGGKGNPSDGSGPVAICTTLTRHGVPCEAIQQDGSNDKAGDALMHSVGERKADLLVMGCYGHSRFRESVLGGASRYILANMTVPVLMSH